MENGLHCNADWRLASDRIIENHITYLVKGVDPRKLKSFLEELLAAAGFIPYTVFLKLKPYLNAVQLGQESMGDTIDSYAGICPPTNVGELKIESRLHYS